MRRSVSDTLPDFLAEEPEEPAEAVPPPATRKKKSRKWERRKRREVGQVSYRGIPKELNERVKAVAAELHVTTGDVARALLEYGLEAYSQGELTLEPQPKTSTVSFTLFPESGE